MPEIEDYRWESFPNPEVRVLHVGGEGFPGGREGADPATGRLFAAIRATRGVVSAEVTGRYEVMVEKGRVFPWGPIEAAVIDAFRLHVAAPSFPHPDEHDAADGGPADDDPIAMALMKGINIRPCS